MAGDSRSASSSMRLSTAVLVLLALFLVSSATPARADELIFETETQRVAYDNWVLSGGRQAWLYMVDDLMVPCLLNQHDKCQKNMAEALNRVPDTIRNARVRVGERTERLLYAVRNNQFLYQTAFSLRMLKSIVDQGGDCADWEARAVALTGVSTGALEKLRGDAALEIGTRQRLPEAKELKWIDTQLERRGCGAQSGD